MESEQQQPEVPSSVELTFEDGKSKVLDDPKMSVARFIRAMAFTDPLREEKVLDLAYNQPDGWSLSLTPESFTKAADLLWKSNRAFVEAVARKNALSAAAG